MMAWGGWDELRQRFSGGIQGGQSNSSQQSIYQADTAGQSTDPPKIRCQTDRFVRILRPRHSDIDFLVELERLTFRDYIGLVLFLEDLFQKDVDLVTPTSVKPGFKPYIEKEIEYVRVCKVFGIQRPKASYVLLGRGDTPIFDLFSLQPRRGNISVERGDTHQRTP